MGRLIRFASWLVVIAVVGGLGAHEVAAQLQPQMTLRDPCRGVPANATVAWNGTTGQIHSASPDAAYATGVCGRWVVDVDVGPFSVVPHHGYAASFHLGGYPIVPRDGMAVALDQTQCTNLVVDELFYKAGADGALVRAGHSQVTAVWQVTNGQGACVLPKTVSDSFTGSTSATTRYRMALIARLQGSPVKVDANGIRGANP